MKFNCIRLAREGGVGYFPGLSQPVTVDLSDWSQQDKTALEALLRQMPTQSNTSGDRFSYRAIFDSCDDERTVFIEPESIDLRYAGLVNKLIDAWRNALENK